MSRLINADALTERMYHDAFETDTDMQKWDSGCWIRYKMFEKAIEDAPSIDIVRRKPELEWFEWIDAKTGKKKRQPKWFADAWKLPAEERARVRSKTFPGIAKAMAEQWGEL